MSPRYSGAGEAAQTMHGKSPFSLPPSPLTHYNHSMRRLVLLCALAMVSGCAQPRPVFDQARAYADLVQQTEFGPRIPGSSGHAQCATWLQDQLRPLADSMWTQEFSRNDSSELMTNVIARFSAASREHIVIAAHWDTRPHADRDPDSTKWSDPVLGANDGASGVAVLLELARLFDSIPPPIGVDLVFFDGEDGGEYATFPGEWCLGSFHFAAHLPKRYKWGILLDMIGDKGLDLPIEGNSFRLAPEVVDRIWTRAESLQETAFQRVRGDDVFDDHMALLMKGIPTVDIIDFDYPYWHTTQDTPDKCAPESLGAVGRVLVAVIYDL
jgi:hypothetical protein